MENPRENASSRKPTYGLLIDLFKECESEAGTCTAEELCLKFKSLFPEVYIGRPKRFYETVLRIVSPTQPSLRDGPKLTGSPLESYRSRTWEPRLRNTPLSNSSAAACTFPTDLNTYYGLNEQVLLSTWQHVSSGKGVQEWKLHGIPNVGFYRLLHYFLKKWKVTRNATKIAIGNFYKAIDENHQQGRRSDNVYRFIERVVMSNKSSDEVMIYTCMIAKHPERKEVEKMQVALADCAEQLDIMNVELSETKQKFETAWDELRSARVALKDVTSQNVTLKRKQEKKENQFQKLEYNYASLEEELLQLEDTTDEYLMTISELETELASTSDSQAVDTTDFTFQTKSGRKYSPAIRKLYYSLLADQVPAARIAQIVKTVVKCFNSSIDVEQLKLPQRSCASYMRKGEMKSVSDAHKAAVLCDQVNRGFHLNTDGTTKMQKKIGGVAVNNTVISVNELPDGKAESAIADVSKQLEKLRETARALNLPNPDSINWTLIVSSTSDSASTQKKFNKLIDDCRKLDEQRFGAASVETVELIESFCSMHLGVNLRKAFLSGIAEVTDDPEIEKKHHSHPVDTFIHEFCKLFGKSGTPEYGCGVVTFKDYLLIKSSDASLSDKERSYYDACTKVTLDRQVGSRYFVSAANATKVIFLREAALHFLKYTGKNNGNKLEKEVFLKLSDTDLLLQLVADSLMYYHVYADLVMLSKSNELKKSVLDMNTHFLELQLYLQEVEQHPEVILDKSYKVFRSEKRLYGEDCKVNHRCNLKSQPVYERLFGFSFDIHLLYPLIVAGTSSMREKLCTYAESQLPGGRYWNPEPSTKKILSELRPSNDLCESILGLNDYLTTAIPNLHQMARSNLVEVKKNKTIKWLDSLPEMQQLEVLDFAYSRRRNVIQEYKDEEEKRCQQRRQNMVLAHERREALKQKALLEKEKLSHECLMTTSAELKQAILHVDSQKMSTAKKRAAKQNILKTQINIRKKVLGQNIRIYLSHSGKQRPICDVVTELAQFIDQNSACSLSVEPTVTSLVNKHIYHKFDMPDGTSRWFHGTVISYSEELQSHEIVYDGEDDHCFYDLTVDLINGDLQILD